MARGAGELLASDGLSLEEQRDHVVESSPVLLEKADGPHLGFPEEGHNFLVDDPLGLLTVLLNKGSQAQIKPAR